MVVVRKLRPTYHPALMNVYWTWGGMEHPNCEFAEYKGHKLRVRHLPYDMNSGVEDRRHIGWCDGKRVGMTLGSMETICLLLFSHVDKLK